MRQSGSQTKTHTECVIFICFVGRKPAFYAKTESRFFLFIKAEKPRFLHFLLGKGLVSAQDFGSENLRRVAGKCSFFRKNTKQ